MEWPLFLLILFGSLLLLMLMGIPVAFSFLIIIIIGAPLTWGLGPGMSQVILSLSDSLMNFALLPLPLFILMGTILFHSGMAKRVIDIMDDWMGRMPGRLSVLTLVSGTVFATLSGSTIATSGTLGLTWQWTGRLFQNLDKIFAGKPFKDQEVWFSTPYLVTKDNLPPPGYYYSDCGYDGRPPDFEVK